MKMNLKNKKLFIFDLDGTLVDTAPDFKNSLNYMLSELNEPLVTLEEIRNLVGYGARELIRRTVVTKNIPHDENKINEMLKIFLLHYTHNIDDDSVLFENVETVLKLIKSKKLKLAVCTNKMEKLTQSKIIGMSDAELKDYIKQGFADVTEHDMIDKELYYRDQRRILID